MIGRSPSMLQLAQVRGPHLSKTSWASEWSGPVWTSRVSIWGNDVAASAPTGAGSWLNIDTLLPAAGQLIRESTSDPYKKLETATAKLRSYMAKGASARAIDVARGEVIAAQKEVSLYEEGVRSKREWSMLGKVAIVFGIGLLGAGILLVLRRAARI